MSVRAGVNGTGLTFFFLEEAETIEAVAARIVPGDEDDPGAREIGVLTYLDRALAGPYAAWQLAYREGIRALNASTTREHGHPFPELTETAQDAVIAALEGGQVAGVDASGGAEFFAMVWAHVVEGMFSDPAYGGNRDAAGWKLIGFPGAQYGYSTAQMRYGADLTTEPIATLADVRALARQQPNLFYRRPLPAPAPPPESIPAMPPLESTADAPTMHGASSASN